MIKAIKFDKHGKFRLLISLSFVFCLMVTLYLAYHSLGFETEKKALEVRSHNEALIDNVRNILACYDGHSATEPDEVKYCQAQNSALLTPNRYHIILNGDDVLVYHPEERSLGKKIGDLFLYDEVFSQLGRYEEESLHLLTKAETGQALWIYQAALYHSKQAIDTGTDIDTDSKGWRIVSVVEDISLSAHQVEKRRQYILLVLFCVVTVFIYFMMILRVRDAEEVEYWQLAIIFSILCLLGVSFIWNDQLHRSQPMNDEEYIIRDDIGIMLHHVHLDKGLDSSEYHVNKSAPEIPLGLRIDSINIAQNNEVNISGLIWVRNLNQERAEGFELEFPDTFESEITPYLHENDTRSWQFNLSAQQHIKPENYPFERDRISLRITTQGYNNQYRLVPDFSGMGISNPGAMPGISESITMKGWNLFQTYFSYRTYRNTFNYSNGDPLHDGELSELHYNVEIGRKFLNPFISDMIPILSIAALLFLVLMTLTKNELHMAELGFSASSVLGYGSGLFFILIVSHVYLREKLNIDRISYIEQFYFLMYFVILSVSLSSILFTSRFDYKIASYKDGFILKLLYWPVILGGSLVFTAISFYK